MRRIALSGLTLLLPALLAGCGNSTNPFEGFGSFISNTHTFTALKGNPPATSPNEKRVTGERVALAPLMPETGEVWPGPPKPIPSLEDIAKMNNDEPLPPPDMAPLPPSVFPPLPGTGGTGQTP